MSNQISHHEALIYAMVFVSASDRSMSDDELQRIGDIIKTLPIFKDFDPNRIIQVASDCSKVLQSESGLQDIMRVIADALPEELFDTAYALAVDVAAVDQHFGKEELRVLTVLGDALNLDRTTTESIERGAIARFRRL